MPIITLEAVTYRYPEAEQPALSGITAAVNPGEVILLRGSSGSGKSTLLRCLNGLVPHSTGGQFRGRVVVCGLDTRSHPPRELGTHVGFVFQHPDAQFVLEDVEAELAFGLENLGLSRPLMRKRVEEVIDQVGINPLRAGWMPIPLGLRDARVHAQRIGFSPSPARGAGQGEGVRGPTICRVDGVHHRYDTAPAVQGVSLTLRRGEVVALMGRNGSGKTTLLKLIGGALRPQRGSVSNEGLAAYVPQDADSLLFAASVDEELRGQPAAVVAPFA